MDKPKDLQHHAAVETVLNFDSIAFAEDVGNATRMPIEEAVRTLGLGLEMNKQAMARKLMVESGDTISGDRYERFRSVVTREGFEVVHENTFNPGPWEGGKQPDRLFTIWVNRQYGLVLVQSVYTYEDEANGIVDKTDEGKCYFAWRPHKKAEVTLGLLGSGGWESESEPNWRKNRDDFSSPNDLYFRGYHHVGNGLIHKLQNMLLKGELLPQWPEHDDGKYPLMGVFCTNLDYKKSEMLKTSNNVFDQLSYLSDVSCSVYDSLPVLHPIMNVKPTWRT